MTFNHGGLARNFGRPAAKRRRFRLPIWPFVVAFILALITVPIIVEHALKRTVTFTVQDKAIMATHSDNNGHKYMIYTDKGVYEDTDTIAFFKFDSSDVYGQLKVGHTYKCDVTGVRIPLLSTQKNIIGCSEVQK